MPKETTPVPGYFCENMTFAAREAMKKLRTNTTLVLPKTDACKIIGVTSSQAGEGKSSTIINLAYSFAELGNKVLVVDSDLRRPSIADKLELTSEIGLGDLLTDNDDISSAIQRYQDSTGKAGFDLICGKGYFENASELLSSRRFTSLLNMLIKAYEYILIDLPPVSAVIDAVVVGKHTDGLIVVVRENKIPRKQFENCISQIEFANIKILGVVVNGSTSGAGKKYQYQYNSYGSYGYYGHK